MAAEVDVVKEGLLAKLPRSKGGGISRLGALRKVEKERLFRLLDNKILSYWDTDKDGNPITEKGKVLLDKAIVSVSVDDPTVFQCNSATDIDNSIVCRAKSKTEAEEWVKAIERVLKGNYELNDRLQELSKILDMPCLTASIDQEKCSECLSERSKSAFVQTFHVSFLDALIKNITRIVVNDGDQDFKEAMKLALFNADESLIIEPMDEFVSKRNREKGIFHTCEIDKGVMRIQFSCENPTLKLESLGSTLRDNLKVDGYPYRLSKKVKRVQITLNEHLHDIKRILGLGEEIKITLETDYNKLTAAFPSCVDVFFETFHDLYLKQLVDVLQKLCEASGGNDMKHHISKPFYSHRVLIRPSLHQDTQLSTFKSSFHDGCLILDVKEFTVDDRSMWTDISSHVLIDGVPMKVKSKVDVFSPILRSHLERASTLLSIEGEIELEADFETLRCELSLRNHPIIIFFTEKVLLSIR